MTDLKVVQFPGENLNDIPAMMRAVADSIEKGEWGDVKFVAAVLVRRDLAATTFGWGECSFIEAIGAFAHGMSLPDGAGNSE